MKSLFLGILILIFGTGNGYSQLKKHEVELSIQRSFPFNYFSKEYESGSSINISDCVFFDEKNGILFTIGKSQFAKKNSGDYKVGSIYEAKVGFKYKSRKLFYCNVSSGFALYNQLLSSRSGFLMNFGSGIMLSLKTGAHINIHGQMNYGTNRPSGIFWFSTGFGISFSIKRIKHNSK